jgi:hypothetical protein
VNGSLYLSQWRAATQRANCTTPDLFSSNRFKILGIRRTLIKLGASLTVDLEKLDGHELEQVRVEIAAQLSSRRRGTSAEQPLATTKEA